MTLKTPLLCHFETPLQNFDTQSRSPYQKPPKHPNFVGHPKPSFTAEDLSKIVQDAPKLWPSELDERNHAVEELSKRINDFVIKEMVNISGCTCLMCQDNSCSSASVKQADGSLRQIMTIEQRNKTIYVARKPDNKVVLDIVPKVGKVFSGGYKRLYQAKEYVIDTKTQEVAGRESLLAMPKTDIDAYSVWSGFETHKKFYSRVSREIQQNLVPPPEILSFSYTESKAIMPRYTCDLNQLLNDPKKYCPDIKDSDWLKMLADIGKVLIAFHKEKVSHNDIKLPNVLLDYDNKTKTYRVLVNDFDLWCTNYETQDYLQKANRPSDDAILHQKSVITPFYDCFALVYMLGQCFLGDNGMKLLRKGSSPDVVNLEIDSIIQGKIKPLFENHPQYDPTIDISVKKQQLVFSGPLDPEIQNMLTNAIKNYSHLFDLIKKMVKLDQSNLREYNKTFLTGGYDKLDKRLKGIEQLFVEELYKLSKRFEEVKI